MRYFLVAATVAAGIGAVATGSAPAQQTASSTVSVNFVAAPVTIQLVRDLSFGQYFLDAGTFTGGTADLTRTFRSFSSPW